MEQNLNQINQKLIPINEKLIQTENQLKEIVESGEPKSIMYDGKKYYMSKKKIKEIRELIPVKSEKEDAKEGGILPLVALLPLIFGGITAASAATAGIASAVKDSKIAALASSKTGTGLYLNPYEGKALNDFFKSKGLSVKKNGVSVFKGSSGIYLKPFSSNQEF